MLFPSKSAELAQWENYPIADYFFIDRNAASVFSADGIVDDLFIFW